MLRPLSWKSNGQNITIITRDKLGERQALSLKAGDTNVLLFNESLEDKDLVELANELDYSYARISNYNNDVAIVRDAIDINSLYNIPWHEGRTNPMGILSSFFESRNISPYKWIENLDTIDVFSPHIENPLFLEIKQKDRKIVSIEMIADKYYLFNGEESKIINSFFDALDSFEYDRVIHFNSQIPLLTERAENYGFTFESSPKVYQTPLGSVTKNSYDFITEEWDLLPYFRLKFSHFSDFHLSTIYNHICIHDKSDKKDIEKVRILYGMVKNDIERLCNLVHITGETLLRSAPSQIIDHLGYQMDPGTVFKRGYKNKKNGDFFIFPEVGIYRDCYVYNYSKILLDSMYKQDSKITKDSIDRLGDQGIVLSLALWNCRFTQSNDEDIRNFFDKYERNIVEINDKIVVSVSPLPLELIDKYDLYVVYGKVGRYIVSKGMLHCIGAGGVFCPKNKAESQLLENWINHIMYGSKYKLATKLTSEDVKVGTKVKSKEYYDSNTISFLLASQYEEKYGEIEDWVDVEYIIVDKKPILYTQNKKIDTSYYHKRIKELHARLRKLE